MSNSLLRAVNLGKRFANGPVELVVFEHLHLDIAGGEMLGVIGESGAGKSTLLHLLGGLDSPNRGQIIFAGKDLAKLPGLTLARLRNTQVGFIFQAYHLLPELTALENVCLPARMARAEAEATSQRGHELLTRVGLGERLEHKPYELSGGEQQRVAIARSLINTPALILADEPTGNLDSHTGEEIISLLCALHSESNTTLMVATHDAKIAERAPRVLQLADGLIASPQTV